MQKQKYTNDKKFKGNILGAGKTGCGKTSFGQRIDVSNLFGDIKKVEWVSQIEFSVSRDAEIQSCFAALVEFQYPSKVEELDNLLVHFTKISSRSNVDNNSTFEEGNIFGEKEKMDRLIVMDHISGLADGSNNFLSSLTVSQKFKNSCLYIFLILFIQKKQHGNQFNHRRKFLISFLVL